VFDNLDKFVNTNQPNHEDLCTLLESPPCILELEDVIPIEESFCTFQKRLVMFSRLAGALEIGESDGEESS
jgi:hypothetical protein